MNHFKTRSIFNPYQIASVFLVLAFFSHCFFGTSETVLYNVSTIVYGSSKLPLYVTYMYQFVVAIMFLIAFDIRILHNRLALISLIFIFWIGLVPFLANDNFLTNIKYSFYILTILIGLMAVKSSNIERFLQTNIIIFQIMGISILLFSIVVIFNNPIPSFRGVRSAVMHSNANEDALILSVSLPFLFLIRSKVFRTFSILYLLYFLTLYNSTRGAIVAVTFVLVIMYYNFFRNNRVIFSIFILLFFIFTSDFYVKNILNDSLFKVGVRSIEYYGEGNLTGRIAGIWIPIAEHTLENSPLYGFGDKSYHEDAHKITYYTSGIRRIHDLRSPHNFFIMVLYDWGIIGLILFLSIYIYIFRLAFKNFTRNTSTISSALFASWVAFTIMNFIANSFSYRGWSIFVILSTTTYFLIIRSKLAEQKKIV